MNRSEINITNNVFVSQSDTGEGLRNRRAIDGGLTLAIGAGAVATVGAVTYGAISLFDPALTLILDAVYGVAHLVSAGIAFLPAALHLIGWICAALVTTAIAVAGFEALADWRAERSAPAPVAPAKVLVLMTTPDQAQEAIKLLPDSTQIEFIEMPARREVINA